MLLEAFVPSRASHILGHMSYSVPLRSPPAPTKPRRAGHATSPSDDDIAARPVQSQACREAERELYRSEPPPPHLEDQQSEVEERLCGPYPSPRFRVCTSRRREVACWVQIIRSNYHSRYLRYIVCHGWPRGLSCIHPAVSSLCCPCTFRVLLAELRLARAVDQPLSRREA